MQESDALILGAFLHDVGKMWQRTNADLQEKYRSLCVEPSQHRSFSQCPTCTREFGYAHVLLSRAFILENLGQEWSLAANLTSAHHKSQGLGYSSKLIQLADRLSSQERAEQEEGDPPVKQLLSVFARVYENVSSWYFPLQSLGLEKGRLFPSPESDGKTKDKYTILWDNFVWEVGEAKGLYREDFSGLFTTLYYLLQKYTWCVPSAYHHDVPDVSLFDHLRTTCAIAVSLYNNTHITETDVDFLLQKDGSHDIWKKPCFSLIGGDVSGVQRFLYTQTSKGVARGLRGRSFYLELLTEVAALWVLRQLELPITNLLYSGGGHFYILSHCIEGTKLSQLRCDLARPLLEHHRGELYLALAAKDFSPQDLKPENFANIWAGVTRELNVAKRRRFQELKAQELSEEVFKPQGRGDASDTCAVCRREGAPYFIEEGVKECNLCHDLKDLGRDLAEAKYILITPAGSKRPDAETKEWQKLFGDLGFDVRLFSQIQRRELEGLEEGALLLRLNSTDFLDKETLPIMKDLKHPPALGFRFLAQATPWKSEQPNEIADFETLAEASEGVRRIGILRMDVDDLGKLFREGLGRQNASISRVASLSFLLRLFFEGWLNQLCTEFNPYTNGKEGEDKVYAIYAGGDDLFIAGAWSAIPELAHRIHEDFSDFTCHNPGVHISAGTAIEDPHAPLYLLAEQARESLDSRAKRRSVNGQEKNAIDFLNRTMDWDELKQVNLLCQILKRLVAEGEEKEKVPRALLQLLMTLYERYQEAQNAPNLKQGAAKGPRLHYGPWLWQAAYFLTRLIDSLKEKAPPELIELKESLTDAQQVSKVLPRAALAARWAELLTRKEKE